MSARPRIPRLCPRRAASIVALALALALVGACGGGSEAAGPTTSTAPDPPGPAVAVQDDHLPVPEVTTLEQIPERLDLIAATGARHTRVDLFWRDVAPERPADPTDPTDAAYDFSRYDAIMTGLAERRIAAIVSVYNTPPWAAGGQLDVRIGNVNTATPDPNDFARFMGAVARRYSGELEVDGATLPEVRHLELWNEPSLPGFLNPQRDDTGRQVAIDNYAAMATAAYPEIKRANPDAVVIAGVAGPNGLSSATRTGARDWIRGLAAGDVPMDAYSQHIYPAQPPTVDSPGFLTWGNVDGLLAEVDQISPGLPVYITEAGYTTAPTPFRDTAGATLAQQAEYLRQIFALPEVATSARIRAIVWFNLEDNPGWPAGLLLAGGAPKPSLEAFREVAAAAADQRL